MVCHGRPRTGAVSGSAPCSAAWLRLCLSKAACLTAQPRGSSLGALNSTSFHQKLDAGASPVLGRPSLKPGTRKQSPARSDIARSTSHRVKSSRVAATPGVRASSRASLQHGARRRPLQARAPGTRSAALPACLLATLLRAAGVTGALRAPDILRQLPVRCNAPRDRAPVRALRPAGPGGHEDRCGLAPRARGRGPAARAARATARHPCLPVPNAADPQRLLLSCPPGNTPSWQHCFVATTTPTTHLPGNTGNTPSRQHCIQAT